jgi:hypothetical protein
MSFSTPAMTGSSEFRESKSERPYVSPSFNLANAENPWKSKVQSACAPPSAFSPWQCGAPSACSPWQCGAPSMSLHSNYARANPWSEIIPTTSRLASVDIQVLSESEQADAEKNKNQRTIWQITAHPGRTHQSIGVRQKNLRKHSFLLKEMKMPLMH